MAEKPDRGHAHPVIRLYVVSEGLTEVNFVERILRAHLEATCPGAAAVDAPNLSGARSFTETRKLVRNLLRPLGDDVLVTTMIDLFKLPQDYPEYSSWAGFDDPVRRVEELESAFARQIDDRRFVPYFQLHEFEALILTDANALAPFYPKHKQALSKLAATVEKEHRSPETVNRTTPPSYRIGQAVPEYQKALSGVDAIERIGLAAVREKCKHFDGWLGRLEKAVEAKAT